MLTFCEPWKTLPCKYTNTNGYNEIVESNKKKKKNYAVKVVKIKPNWIQSLKYKDMLFCNLICNNRNEFLEWTFVCTSVKGT